MATHSSVLAWEIPWKEEPGGLQTMELQRVRRNLATKQQKQSILLPYLWQMYTYDANTRETGYRVQEPS